MNRPRVIYGNVRNTGLIDNLPDGCVEVACLVDRNGVQPYHFGALPAQLAALNHAHMAVNTLMVEALLHRDKEAARYALQLDPLSAARSAVIVPQLRTCWRAAPSGWVTSTQATTDFLCTSTPAHR